MDQILVGHDFRLEASSAEQVSFLSIVKDVRIDKLFILFFWFIFFKDKPKDTQVTISSGEVKLGDRVDITCWARANPSPEYKFYYNDKLIRWSSKGLLSLTSVNTEDQGTYRCVPVNYLGEGSEASVTVTLSTGM